MKQLNVKIAAMEKANNSQKADSSGNEVQLIVVSLFVTTACCYKKLVGFISY